MGEKYTKKHTQKTAKNKKEKPKRKRKTRNENMEKDTQFSTALGEWANRGDRRGDTGRPWAMEMQAWNALELHISWEAEAELLTYPK